MKKKIKIGVVGAGSIGGTFATFLSSAGYDVEITRPKGENLTLGNTIHFEVTGALGNKSYLVPFVEGNEFTSKKDVLLICSKAYGVKNSLQATKQYLKPNGVVLSLQNVLHLNQIAEVIDVNHYVPMLLDWSSRRTNNTEITVLHSGVIHIGPLGQETVKYLPMLKEILSSVAPTKIEHNMYNFMLSRFILHCNQSCLGALTGYNLGTYLKEKQGKKIFIELIREQIALFEHLNITIPPYNGCLDYYKFVENSVGGILYRSKMFKVLINQNGSCVSATLRQLENAKKSELDFLCNYFVNLANGYGMTLPYNTVMTEMLYEIERGERSIMLENLTDDKFLDI